MPGSSPLRVLVPPPLPDDGWVSIERYAAAIEEHVPPEVCVSRSPVPPVGGPGPLARYRARYRGYPDLLRTVPIESEADLVHIPDQALGHLVACARGLPTVVTCHDLMPFLLEAHYGSRFFAWFDRHLLSRSLHAMLGATRIVTVSTATRDELVRVLDADPSRIDIVPNLLRPEYAVDGPRRLDLPPGPRILSVGRTAPYKNLEALIEALSGIPGARLIRVGESLTDAQRSLARSLGVDGRIQELGPLDPAELAVVYRSCDVLAQPSLYEGFGVPVVEAMACGLPVVCSDGGALPEVAGDAAAVVPLASVDFPAGLAAAITRLLSEPDAASMLRSRGLDRAHEFRPQRVIPRLVRVYEAAMEEHSA